MDTASCVAELRPNLPLMVDGFDWSWAFVIYRELKNFPGYWIGSDGSLWSFRDNTGKPKGRCRRIKPSVTKSGHLKKHLTDNNCMRKVVYFHRAVASTFLGECPDGMVCRHLDGKSDNNRPYNLAWGTVLDNIHDRDKIHKTTARGEVYPHTHLKNDDIPEIYDLYEQGWFIKDIAGKFGIDSSECSKILRGICWSHAVPDRQPPLLGKDARLNARRKWGEENPNAFATGENNHNAKLSMNDAREIRRILADGGRTITSVAKQYGVSRRAVGYIKAQITYKEVIAC